MENESTFPYDMMEEEETRVEIPERPTVVGSAELKDRMKQAAHIQQPLILPKAKLLDIKRTGEPEDYKRMNFFEAVLPFLVASKGIDMRRTMWIGANLEGAQFIDVNLHESSFRNASAPGIRADKAEMHKCDLMNANFTDGSFVGAKMQSSLMEHVNFTRANLSYADLAGVQMDWGTLIGVFARETKFMEASLTAINAEKATFIGCNFAGASLTHANLTDALFEDCTLVNTNLTFADLSGLLLGKDTEKAYTMLKQANWRHVSSAFFDVLTDIPAAKMNAITPSLRAGQVPKEPLWQAWELPKPKGGIEEQRACGDPLLIVQLFLNGLHDVSDSRYNKLPLMKLINDWFDEFNKIVKNSH